MGLKEFTTSVGIVAVLLSCASTASAIELVVDPTFGSTGDTGATAALSLEFGDHGDDDILTLMIANTTSPKIGSKLTAVGLEMPDFLIHPPTLVPSMTTAYFDTLTFNDSMSPATLDAPGGYDLVISSDGNFLGGPPTGAPSAGARESVMLNLGDTGMSSADLAIAFEQFYASFRGRFVVGRFQVVGAGGEGSDKVGGGLIPEPATLVLLAMGGLAVLRRRFHR